MSRNFFWLLFLVCQSVVAQVVPQSRPINGSGRPTIDTSIQTNKTKTIADTTGKVLEDVVLVASSRTNNRLEDLPTKVEVLGAEEVHEENQIKPGNIASLLGDIAGIQIQQTSAATGNADMRIQGLQGKYTQLLRDGMPLFGGYSGSFSILQIPPLDLQQIELIKGASSTLYGGGAIAGMVNLISKKPKLGQSEHLSTINRSTLKENNANFFFSSRNQKVGYTLFTGTTLQRAVDVNGDGFSDVPEVKSIYLHPRFFIYPNQKSTITIGYTLNREDRIGGDLRGIAAKTGPTYFFIRNLSLRNTIDLNFDYALSHNGHLTVKGSTSFFSRDMHTNQTFLKGYQQIWYSEIAYAKKAIHHTWVTGINFNGDQFTKVAAPNGSLLPNEKNRTLGLFAQSDWKFLPKWTWQNGIRYDLHAVYGRFFLPRTAVMFKPSTAWTIRASSGLGYKTPTLFNTEVDERQYNSLLGFDEGIRAERSMGLNMDVNYQLRTPAWRWTVNQTFFYNRINRPLLLQGLPSIWPPNPLLYTNAEGPVVTKGLESYVQAFHDEWELYFGYVYTDAKRHYIAFDPHLPLIAKHKFATVIAYEFSDRIRAGIEAAYTGKQFLEQGDSTPGYLFAACMIRYGIGKCTWVLNVENLFDYRQNKNSTVVFPPYNNPVFPSVWAPMDGRVINLSMLVKW